jgi:sugar O-acyltransferase (sialic acid O-acetyltransferase NeuD family)
MTRRDILPVILLGHAANYVDIIETIEDINAAADSPRYELLGFLDERDEMQGRSFHGYPVLGRHASAHQYPHALFSTWIGGGGYLERERVIAGLGLAPERFATLVHPTACVSPRAQLGSGVVVLQNCTVANQVTVGDHVVVLQNSVLSHDDTIGEYTVITNSVALAGYVKVGRSCYLGANCSIRQRVTIGEGSLVGMGSVVLNDVPPYHVVVGNPARVLREARP